MTGVWQVGPEQVPIMRLIENAWAEFDMRLLSIGALYVVWSSLTTSEDLVARYFATKGEAPLLDRQKSLSAMERDRYECIERRAKDAIRYREWARQNEGQPILRDALVSYCVAFESTLKAVATAFEYARIDGGANEQAYLQPEVHRRVVRDVERSWRNISERRATESTAKAFFRTEVFAKNPNERRWAFNDADSEKYAEGGSSPRQYWNVASEAFVLRNAIVHANGRLTQRVEIGKEQFYEREDIRLTFMTLDAVHTALRVILYPLSPDPF